MSLLVSERTQEVGRPPRPRRPSVDVLKMLVAAGAAAGADRRRGWRGAVARADAAAQRLSSTRSSRATRMTLAGVPLALIARRDARGADSGAAGDEGGSGAGAEIRVGLEPADGPLVTSVAAMRANRASAAVLCAVPASSLVTSPSSCATTARTVSGWLRSTPALREQLHRIVAAARAEQRRDSDPRRPRARPASVLRTSLISFAVDAKQVAY